MTNRNEGFMWLIKEKLNFDKIPNPDAYDGYLKSVLVCANGDGTLTAAERDWVIGFAVAFGASDSLIEKLKSYPANEDIEQLISASPASDGSRRFLIYDAIKACSADGQYSEPERATVIKMANKLGVNQDVVQQIEQICVEEASLRLKRLELMYPDGIPVF
jgi:hypothetical protein